MSSILDSAFVSFSCSAAYFFRSDANHVRCVAFSSASARLRMRDWYCSVLRIASPASLLIYARLRFGINSGSALDTFFKVSINSVLPRARLPISETSIPWPLILFLIKVWALGGCALYQSLKVLARKSRGLKIGTSVPSGAVNNKLFRATSSIPST